MSSNKIGEYIYGHRAASAWLAERGWYISHGQLMNLRSEGGGPKIEKFGHSVGYPIKELEAWAREHWAKPDGRIKRPSPV
jgi:hypothetical protein